LSKSSFFAVFTFIWLFIQSPHTFRVEYGFHFEIQFRSHL
jgi:hypothetical protein